MLDSLDVFCQLVLTGMEKAGMRNLAVVVMADAYEKE